MGPPSYNRPPRSLKKTRVQKAELELYKARVRNIYGTSPYSFFNEIQEQKRRLKQASYGSRPLLYKRQSIPAFSEASKQGAVQKSSSVRKVSSSLKQSSQEFRSNTQTEYAGGKQSPQLPEFRCSGNIPPPVLPKNVPVGSLLEPILKQQKDLIDVQLSQWNKKVRPASAKQGGILKSSSLKSPERSRHLYGQQNQNIKKLETYSKEPSVQGTIGEAHQDLMLKEGSNIIIQEEEDKTMDVDKQFQIYENTYRNESKQGGNRNRRLKSAKVRNTNEVALVRGKGRPVSSYGKKQVHQIGMNGLPISAQMSYQNQKSNISSNREVIPENSDITNPISTKSVKRYGPIKQRNNLTHGSSEFAFIDKFIDKSLNEAAIQAEKLAQDKRLKHMEKIRALSRKTRENRKLNAKFLSPQSSKDAVRQSTITEIKPSAVISREIVGKPPLKQNFIKQNKQAVTTVASCLNMAQIYDPWANPLPQRKIRKGRKNRMLNKMAQSQANFSQSNNNLVINTSSQMKLQKNADFNYKTFNTQKAAFINSQSNSTLSKASQGNYRKFVFKSSRRALKRVTEGSEFEKTGEHNNVMEAKFESINIELKDKLSEPQKQKVNAIKSLNSKEITKTFQESIEIQNQQSDLTHQVENLLSEGPKNHRQSKLEAARKQAAAAEELRKQQEKEEQEKKAVIAAALAEKKKKEEIAAAEQKRKQEEAARIEAERKEQERIANEKKRIEEAEKRQAAEKKRLEEERIAAEKEAERIRKQREAEREAKVAEIQRKAEELRIKQERELQAKREAEEREAAEEARRQQEIEDRKRKEAEAAAQAAAAVEAEAKRIAMLRKKQKEDEFERLQKEEAAAAAAELKRQEEERARLEADAATAEAARIEEEKEFERQRLLKLRIEEQNKEAKRLAEEAAEKERQLKIAQGEVINEDPLPQQQLLDVPRFATANPVSITEIPSYSEHKRQIEVFKREEAKNLPSFGGTDLSFVKNTSSREYKEQQQAQQSPKSYIKGQPSSDREKRDSIEQEVNISDEEAALSEEVVNRFEQSQPYNQDEDVEAEAEEEDTNDKANKFYPEMQELEQEQSATFLSGKENRQDSQVLSGDQNNQMEEEHDQGQDGYYQELDDEEQEYVEDDGEGQEMNMNMDMDMEINEDEAAFLAEMIERQGGEVNMENIIQLRMALFIQQQQNQQLPEDYYREDDDQNYGEEGEMQQYGQEEDDGQQLEFQEDELQQDEYGDQDDQENMEMDPENEQDGQLNLEQMMLNENSNAELENQLDQEEEFNANEDEEFHEQYGAEEIEHGLRSTGNLKTQNFNHEDLQDVKNQIKLEENEDDQYSDRVRRNSYEQKLHEEEIHQMQFQNPDLLMDNPFQRNDDEEDAYQQYDDEQYGEEEEHELSINYNKRKGGNSQASQKSHYSSDHDYLTPDYGKIQSMTSQDVRNIIELERQQKLEQIIAQQQEIYGQEDDQQQEGESEYSYYDESSRQVNSQPSSQARRSNNHSRKSSQVHQNLRAGDYSEYQHKQQQRYIQQVNQQEEEEYYDEEGESASEQYTTQYAYGKPNKEAIIQQIIRSGQADDYDDESDEEDEEQAAIAAQRRRLEDQKRREQEMKRRQQEKALQEEQDRLEEQARKAERQRKIEEAERKFQDELARKGEEATRLAQEQAEKARLAAEQKALQEFEAKRAQIEAALKKSEQRMMKLQGPIVPKADQNQTAASPQKKEVKESAIVAAEGNGIKKRGLGHLQRIQ